MDRSGVAESVGLGADSCGAETWVGSTSSNARSKLEATGGALGGSPGPTGGLCAGSAVPARCPNGAPQNLQKRMMASHTPWHRSQVTVGGAAGGGSAICTTAAGETATGAGFLGNDPGADGAGGAPYAFGSSAEPQDTQNRPADGLRVWHRAQMTSCSAASGMVGTSNGRSGPGAGTGDSCTWSACPTRVAGMPAGGVGATTRRCSCRRRPQSWQKIRWSGLSLPQRSQITQWKGTSQQARRQAPFWRVSGRAGVLWPP